MRNSSTRRIYLDTGETTPDILTISCAKRIHYMKNVLRMRVADKICIFNEIIGEYFAKVVLCDKKEIKLEILKSENHIKPILCKKLAIAPGIIKNDRFSNLIDMSVQQGVTDIIPLITQYSVHRNFSRERIERIVEEATEQSERFDLPHLHNPTKLEDIDFAQYNVVIFANEKAKVDSICDRKLFLEDNILLLAGPEGGFAEDEITFLSNLPNSYSISLGPRILRSELAINTLISNVNFIRSV